jgi:hypothetical protein
MKDFLCYLRLVVFILLSLSSVNAQDSLYTASKKGKLFLSWGGNRASYSKSDITFKGNGYKFTIDDVEAVDKPKGWHLDYINPRRLTIPQTNFRLGYFISDKYAVSIGVDHMKYVMKRNLFKEVNGYISLPAGEEGSIYNGTYNGNTFISEDFLKLEYTDGLNYVFGEFSRFDDVSKLIGVTNTDIFQLNTVVGLGIGFIYPKTNITLLQKEQTDRFSVSGYGTSLNLGLNFTFFKHFFIQTDLKGGFINMTHTKSTNSSTDIAKHHFFFLESVISFGGIFRI